MGVEGPGGHPGESELPQALHHLARGLVRERHDEDLVRRHGLGRDGVRGPAADDPGLAGARAGEDDDRTFDRQHRLALGVVQVVKETGRVKFASEAGHVVEHSRAGLPED